MHLFSSIKVGKGLDGKLCLAYMCSETKAQFKQKQINIQYRCIFYFLWWSKPKNPSAYPPS